MSSRKTTEQRIAAMDQKIIQMTAQKKELEARKKQEDRKARTRRLVRVGAEVESVLGHPIEEEDLPKLRRFLQSQDARGGYFSRAMEGDKRQSEELPGQQLMSSPPRNSSDDVGKSPSEDWGFLSP